MPHDVGVPTPQITEFVDQVPTVLARVVRDDQVGRDFVGSVALGGYVPGESDVDIAGVSGSGLGERQKRSVAAAIVEVSEVCPARGVQSVEVRWGRRTRIELEGANWARAQWPDTDVIDAAVAPRRGKDAALNQSAVDAILATAATRLHVAAQE